MKDLKSLAIYKILIDYWIFYMKGTVDSKTVNNNEILFICRNVIISSLDCSLLLITQKNTRSFLLSKLELSCIVYI